MANQRARALRKRLTDAERLLWRHLRNRGLGGWKFRRQYPVGPFIVDFICVENNIVIEVDGGQHAEDEESDLKRSAYLNKMGYRVFRFWNNQVLQENRGGSGGDFRDFGGWQAEFPLTPTLSPIGGEGDSLTFLAFLRVGPPQDDCFRTNLRL